MPLAASDITFHYHAGTPVLREITFHQDPGQLLALLGPNGSGKSTLLRLIGGFLTPTSGALTIDGSAVRAMSAAERAKRLAYVPQQPGVAFAFDVRTYVSFARHALGRRDADRYVDEALERLDLAHLARRPMGELSAGQRQRAAIARALAQLAGPREPDTTRVLLADEPFSALDPKHALLVGDLFQSLAQGGVLLVVVLHDLALAGRLADRALLLGAGGELLAEGETNGVLRPEPLRTAFGVDFEAVTRQGELLAMHPTQPR